MHGLKLYWRFIVVYLRNMLEYRFSFYIDILTQVIGAVVGYIVLWTLLKKFGSILDWTYDEMIFLYGIDFFTYGICSLFLYQPMRAVEAMVQDGSFDSILIKPMNPLMHLVCKKFNHAALGHIIVNLVIVGYSFVKLPIHWTLRSIAVFIFVLIGGILIQFSFIIVSATLSFWIVKSTPIIDITSYSFRNFVQYPISIYDKWVQILLTFILPYAFINFYPAQYFLGKNQVFHPFFIFITPVLGGLMFLLAYRFWDISINRYQSTGS